MKHLKDDNIYLITVNLTIEKITKEEFVRDYSEQTTTPLGIGNKIFYDEKDQAIYKWHRGGQKEIILDNINENEAFDFLFDWAVSDRFTISEHLMAVCINKTDLKLELESLLEFAIDDEWDSKSIDKINYMVSLIDKI